MAPTQQQFMHAAPAPILMKHLYQEVYKLQGRSLAGYDQLCQPVCLLLSPNREYSPWIQQNDLAFCPFSTALSMERIENADMVTESLEITSGQ